MSVAEVRNLATVLIIGTLVCRGAEPPGGGDAASTAMRRAHEALAAQDYARAIADLESARRQFERQGADVRILSELSFNLVVCYEKLGEGTRAIAAAQHHLAHHPDDTGVLELLGKLHYVRGSYEEAAKAFEHLKGLVTPTPRLLRQLVSVHTNRRMQQDALAAATQLMGRDRSAGSLEAALEAYVTFMQHEKALGVITDLRKLRGARSMYAYAAGFAHAKLDHRAEAERELRPILDDPVYGDDARFELGAVLGKQRLRIPEALGLLAGLLERDPYYTRAYFQLSQLLFRQRRPEEAQRLRTMHEALQKSEREFRKGREFTAAGLSVEATIFRALGYQRRRQFRKAEAALRTELKRRPDEKRLSGALGNVLFTTERYREAAEVLGRAEPKAEVLQMRGLSLWRQGRVEDAFAFFEGLTRDPQVAVMARAYLGRICLEEFKDPKRALELIGGKETAELPAPAALTAARAHCERGAFAEAAALCERLAKGTETVRSEANLYLAWCVLKMGDPSRAAALLNDVRGVFRGSGRYFTIKAEALEALGDKRAGQYRQWESTITHLEDEARHLRRDVGAVGWPEAAPKLLLLAKNARQRRKDRAACRYALLATEADPASAEALRLLLGCPLTDFVKLSALARLVRLAPDDGSAKKQLTELRTSYGLQ